MKIRLLAVLTMVFTVSACSTFTTPRYSISADTNVALKTLGASAIGIGAFSGPAAFDNSCRAAGPLAPPDGMSHTEYLRKAFEDELKVAGVHATDAKRVVLTGTVKRLEFSSSRGITGGSWDIDLAISSSNGRSLSASEHYEFQSGFIADTACKQTAEAYLPAVQNLIGKIVRAPEFKALVQ
jgi:hypothetical protein